MPKFFCALGRTTCVALVMVVILVAPTRYVWAQSSTAGTLPAGAPSPSDQPGTGVSVDAGETGKGSMSALTQVTHWCHSHG